MAYTSVVENHLIGLTRRLPLLVGYHVPLLSSPNPVIPSQSAAPEKYNSRCFSVQSPQAPQPLTASFCGSLAAHNNSSGTYFTRKYTEYIAENHASHFSEIQEKCIEKYKYRLEKKQIRHYEFKSHKLKPKTSLVQARCMSQKSGVVPGPLYNTKYRCEPKKVPRTQDESVELPAERGMSPEKVEQRLRRQACLFKKKQWEEKQKVRLEQEKIQELKSFSSPDIPQQTSDKTSFFKSKSETFLSKPALNDLKAKIMANKLANNIRKPASELMVTPNRPISDTAKQKIPEQPTTENVEQEAVSKAKPQHPSPFLNSASQEENGDSFFQVNPRRSQLYTQNSVSPRAAFGMYCPTPTYDIKTPTPIYKSAEANYPSPLLVKKSKSAPEAQTLKKNSQNEYEDFLKRVNNFREEQKLHKKKNSTDTIPMRNFVDKNRPSFRSNFNQARKQSSFIPKEQNSIMKVLQEKRKFILSQRELSSITDKPMNEISKPSFLSDVLNYLKSTNPASLLTRALSSGSKKPWKNVSLNEECDGACAPNIVATLINRQEGKSIHRKSGDAEKGDKTVEKDGFTEEAFDKDEAMARPRGNIKQIDKDKLPTESDFKTKTEAVEARVKSKLEKARAPNTKEPEKMVRTEVKRKEFKRMSDIKREPDEFPSDIGKKEPIKAVKKTEPKEAALEAEPKQGQQKKAFEKLVSDKEPEMEKPALKADLKRKRRVATLEHKPKLGDGPKQQQKPKVASDEIKPKAGEVEWDVPRKEAVASKKENAAAANNKTVSSSKTKDQVAAKKEAVAPPKKEAATPVKPPSNPGIWKSDHLKDEKLPGTIDGVAAAESVFDEKLAKEIDTEIEAYPDKTDYKQRRTNMEASAKSMEADHWGETPAPEEPKSWAPPSIWATPPPMKAKTERKYPSAPPPPVILDRIKEKTEVILDKIKGKTEKGPTPVAKESKDNVADKPLPQEKAKGAPDESPEKKAASTIKKSKFSGKDPKLAKGLFPDLESIGTGGKNFDGMNPVELLKALRSEPLKKRLPPSMPPPSFEKKEKIGDLSPVLPDETVLFHHVYSNALETREITLSVDSLQEVRTEVANPEVSSPLISQKDSLDYFGGKTLIDTPLLKKLPRPKYVYSKETPVRRKLRIPKQISEPIPFKYDQILKQTSSEPIDFGIPSAEKKIFPLLLETASEPVDVGYNLPKMYEYKSPWTSDFLSNQKENLKKIVNSILETKSSETKSPLLELTSTDEPKSYQVPYTTRDLYFGERLATHKVETPTSVFTTSIFNSIDNLTSSMDSQSVQTPQINLAAKESIRKDLKNQELAFIPELKVHSTSRTSEEPTVIAESRKGFPSPFLNTSREVPYTQAPSTVDNLLQKAALQARGRTTAHLETPAFNLADVEGMQEEVVSVMKRTPPSMLLCGRESFFPKDVNYIASHIPSDAGNGEGCCDEYRRQLLEEACYCETVTVSVKPDYPEPPPSEFYSRHNPCKPVETWVPSFRALERGDSATEVLLYKVKNNIYKFKCHTVDAWNCMKAGWNIIFGIFSRSKSSEVCHTYEDKLVNMQMSPDRPCYWVCPPPCCPARCKQSVFSRIKGQTGCKRCFTASASPSKLNNAVKLTDKAGSSSEINCIKRSFSTSLIMFTSDRTESPLKRLQKQAEVAYKSQSTRTAPGVEKKKAYPMPAKDNPKRNISSVPRKYSYIKGSNAKRIIKDSRSAYPRIEKPVGNSLLSRTPMNIKPVKPASGCHGISSGRPGIGNKKIASVLLKKDSSSNRVKSRPGADGDHPSPLPSGSGVIVRTPKMSSPNPYKSFADYVTSK